MLLIGAGYLATKLYGGKQIVGDQVLGSTVQASATPAPTSVPIQEVFEDTMQGVKNRVSAAAEETFSAAVDTTKDAAKDAIIETTASTVMSQIEKLPEEEQKEIKGILCK